MAITRRAGVTLRTSFDTELLRSSDWRRLRALAAQSDAIGGRAGFRVEVDDGEPETVVDRAAPARARCSRSRRRVSRSSATRASAR